jgi:hypothetical protein
MGRGAKQTNNVRGPPPIDLTFHAPKAKTEASKFLPAELAQKVEPPAALAKAEGQRRPEVAAGKPFGYTRKAFEGAKGDSTSR